MNRYARMLRNPTFTNRATGQVMPNDTGWQTRHLDALKVPVAFERAIVGLLESWAQYADAHRARYEACLDDHVIGAAWADLGRSIHTLLDGETGRLDCGTLSGFINDLLSFEGHGKS